LTLKQYRKLEKPFVTIGKKLIGVSVLDGKLWKQNSFSLASLFRKLFVFLKGFLNQRRIQVIKMFEENLKKISWKMSNGEGVELANGVFEFSPKIETTQNNVTVTVFEVSA
jgi:hypothetical protein